MSLSKLHLIKLLSYSFLSYTIFIMCYFIMYYFLSYGEENQQPPLANENTSPHKAGLERASYPRLFVPRTRVLSTLKSLLRTNFQTMLDQ